MNEIQTHGRASTQDRYKRGLNSKGFDPIRNKKLLETTAEDFLSLLKTDPFRSSNHRRISAC